MLADVMSESNESAEVLLDDEPMIDPKTPVEGDSSDLEPQAELEVAETPLERAEVDSVEVEAVEIQEVLEASEVSDEPLEAAMLEPSHEEGTAVVVSGASVESEFDAEPQSQEDAVAPETAEIETAEASEASDAPESTGIETAEASESTEMEAAVDDFEPEAQVKTGPGEELTDDELVQATSALIFASPDPLGTGRLVNLLEKPQPARVKQALAEIQERLENAALPLQLREIAGGWRLMTAPEQNETVARLVKARKNEKLSPAGLETLAVVAYRQPVTKADIEAIRGVQCGPMLRNLVDRGLAKVVGRADVPGGPLLYGTTKEFLDRFGMGSLKDLPRDGELLKE
jgi:segregation and condensation protein B